MQLQAQAHARLEAEAAEKAARLQREKALFALSVGPVQNIKSFDRADLAMPAPIPVPKQRQIDDQQVLASSLSDEFDVESLLDTDDQLSFRRVGVSPDVVKKLRRGAWTLQAQIDLHGLRRDQARNALNAFIKEAVQKGLRCVRVVHGKGNGSPGKTPVLKSRVLSWLEQKDEVIAFCQARASEGGQGALVVLLRPS